MEKYQAVLVAPDGDYVTDYLADTVKEVEEAVADQGSRWFFYPFVVIVGGERVTDDSKIVRGFDYYGEVAVFGGAYEGQTLDTFRREVVATCERERRRVTCPKCHGAGKVSLDAVTA